MRFYAYGRNRGGEVGVRDSEKTMQSSREASVVRGPRDEAKFVPAMSCEPPFAIDFFPRPACAYPKTPFQSVCYCYRLRAPAYTRSPPSYGLSTRVL